MKYNLIKKAGTLFLFLLFIGIQSSQAQFWKKLEKRATEAAEEAVLRKAENKAAEKAENAMDSIFNVPNKVGKKNRNKGQQEGSRKTEEIVLPETYDFEWKYGLKMESEAMKQNKKNVGDMKLTYYLNTDTAAFGTLIDLPTNDGRMGKTIMIMDPDSGANVMLMEMNEQKIIQKMPSIAFEDIEEATSEELQKDYKVEKTDTKTILGYACQGFTITTEDGIVKTYIALNAPVSFNKAIANNSKFKPKGFGSDWLKEFENGLMMEMEFISSEKEKYNMKMTCIELVQTPISINLSEYKSFIQMGEE
jgi:hypothetical protein